MFERSEFRSLPVKPLYSSGTRAAGSDCCGSFFWVLFLSTQEKYLARRGETRQVTTKEKRFKQGQNEKSKLQTLRPCQRRQMRLIHLPRIEE